MRNFTILVDMDDTIENLTDAWIAYLNDHYGTSAKKEDITSWDFAEAFPTLEKSQVFGALYDEALWERVKPLPGAVKYLKKTDRGWQPGSYCNCIASKLCQRKDE